MSAAVFCFGCRCSPCVCLYLAKLEPGGEWAARRPEAVRMVKVPLPVVDGRTTYHYSTCPCPRCHALRLGSFATYPDVTPLPAPPAQDTYPTEGEHPPCLT